MHMFYFYNNNNKNIKQKKKQIKKGYLRICAFLTLKIRLKTLFLFLKKS